MVKQLIENILKENRSGFESQGTIDVDFNELIYGGIDVYRLIDDFNQENGTNLSADDELIFMPAQQRIASTIGSPVDIEIFARVKNEQEYED